MWELIRPITWYSGVTAEHKGKLYKTVVNSLKPKDIKNQITNVAVDTTYWVKGTRSDWKLQQSRSQLMNKSCLQSFL